VKWGLLILLVAVAVSGMRSTETPVSITRGVVVGFTAYQLLFMLSILINSARWQRVIRVLFRENSPRLKTLFRINLVAIVGAIAMPVVGAEGLRAIKLRNWGVGVAKATATVACDRLIGIFALVGLGSLFLPTFTRAFAGRLPGPWTMVALAALGVAGVIALRWAATFLSSTRQFVARLIPSDTEPLTWAALLLISVASHLTVGVGFYFLMLTLYPLTLIQATGLFIVSQATRAVPISAFGVTFGEIALVSLGTSIGVPYSFCIAAAGLVLFSRYLTALCGILVELAVDGRGVLDRTRGTMTLSPPEVPGESAATGE